MNDYTLVNDGIFAQNYNETGNIYVTKSQQAVLLHSTQGNFMGEKIVWQQKNLHCCSQIVQRYLVYNDCIIWIKDLLEVKSLDLKYKINLLE